MPVSIVKYHSDLWRCRYHNPASLQNHPGKTAHLRMFNSIKKFILFSATLIFYNVANAQSVYHTGNGHLLLIGSYNDSSCFAESQKLTIDYFPATKIMSGNINLQNLVSGISSIDSLLSAKPRTVTISAYIPVDFLTWDHNVYDLTVPLEIRINDIKITVPSSMKFSHVSQLSSYVCIMESSFELNLSDFNIIAPYRLSPVVSVQFLQTVLRKNRH